MKLVRVVPVLADVVRPYGRLGEALSTQDVADGRLRVRRQARLCQAGDDPVAQVPPACGRRERLACQGGRQQQAQREPSDSVR